MDKIRFASGPVAWPLRRTPHPSTQIDAWLSSICIFCWPSFRLLRPPSLIFVTTNTIFDFPSALQVGVHSTRQQRDNNTIKIYRYIIRSQTRGGAKPTSHFPAPFSVFPWSVFLRRDVLTAKRIVGVELEVSCSLLCALKTLKNTSLITFRALWRTAADPSLPRNRRVQTRPGSVLSPRSATTRPRKTLMS